MADLPKRTGDTMMDAIALSSPSGRMSKRARAAAERRLSIALFGPNGLQPEKRPEPTNEQKRERLLQRAREMRRFSELGMRPRAYRKEAERLEKEAAELQS